MIINFGSINYDLIFRLQEMPQAGQTLLADSLEGQAGGKGGNQAVAAARDGAQVVMVGAVGKDGLAEPALANMVTCGVDMRHLVHVPQAPTGCASITINGAGQNMIIVAAGANMLAKTQQIDDELLNQADIVLMQMENDPKEIATLIERAHNAGKMTILNLAPAIYLNAETLSQCSLVIVNEDEAVALGQWLHCESDAKSLGSKLGTGVMRTLGERGAEAFVGKEEFFVEAYPVDAVDTTAAGDCFIGVLASSLEKGLEMRKAMQRAAKAAALACSKRGSQGSIPYEAETNSFVS